jgi:pyruvate formate lyase activating enzyme
MTAPQADRTLKGCVFNIQHYSVHDGPGIRTIVFLKGCPLRCEWCCNPESQRLSPELAYNPQKCISVEECFRCKDVCGQSAIGLSEDRKITINREICDLCFACSDACPSRAMHVFGKYMTINEVLKIVEADSAFYARSDGGLTISGGEPLMQPEFTLALLREARRRHIDTTVETCGFADWAILEEIGGHLKFILFDIKTMNDEKHRAFTGVSNELILNNFRKLRDTFPQLHILARIPLIPGLNDSEEEIAEILSFLQGMKNVSCELLPYHRIGQSKYEFLGRDYTMAGVKLSDEKAQSLKDYVSANYAGDN